MWKPSFQMGLPTLTVATMFGYQILRPLRSYMKMALTFSSMLDCLDNKLIYANFAVGEEKITYQLEPCEYHKNDDSWTHSHFWFVILWIY
ncbi:hypothetical protein Hanom_Chr05g00428261 [Helianthus anomalus]